MRVIPLCYCPTLSEEDIYRHECSDRIWVPRHIFERWLTAEEVGSVVIVQLEGIPACMYAPHAGDRNVIYAPMWMCEELGTSLDPPGDDDTDTEDDYIVLERLQPAMCTFLKVQPHTSDHLPACVGGAGGDAMPEDTLSRAFEEYTCLRQGQTVMLNLPSGSRMFVTIDEATPAGPVCIRSTEVAMDLLEPLDAPPARPPTPPPAPLPLLFPEFPTYPSPPVAVQPLAQQPQPQEETHAQKRARMLAAATARMATTSTTNATP
jgi:hypothetical protein